MTAASARDRRDQRIEIAAIAQPDLEEHVVAASGTSARPSRRRGRRGTCSPPASGRVERVEVLVRDRPALGERHVRRVEWKPNASAAWAESRAYAAPYFADPSRAWT